MSGKFRSLTSADPRSFAAQQLLYKSSSHAAASYDKPWLGISEIYQHLVDEIRSDGYRAAKKDGEGMYSIAHCFIHPLSHSCRTYFGFWFALADLKPGKWLNLQEIPVEA